MGVWWGLRHSADGKSPGIEVLILGGVHGDMPIDPNAGAVVADLVADESVDVLIDVSRHANGKMWTKGERIRFVRDYFVRLYERQGEHRRPIMQVLDEAARFVPQIIRHGEEDVAQCMGAIASMVEEGRNIGVGVCLLTQRSARLNKDVAELADCMIAFRIVGPLSIKAVLDWFGEHIPKERWKGLIEIMRKLPIGRALVVSPGWLEFEGEALIRPRETFDSSATPKPGQKAKKPHGAAAKPDLKKYQDRMRETIEQARANDPRELKKKISELQRELAKKPPAPATKTDNTQTIRAAEFNKAQRALEAAMKFIVDINTRNFDAKLPEEEIRKAIDGAVTVALKRVEAIIEARQQQFNVLKRNADQALRQMRTILDADVPVKLEVRHNEPFSVTPSPQPATQRAMSDSQNGEVPSGGIQRMMIALAQRPGLSAKQIAVRAVLSSRSGTFGTYLTTIKKNGWAVGDRNAMELTPEGLQALGDYTPLPQGQDLYRYWLNQLGASGAGRMLTALVETYPKTLTKAELGEAANISHLSGTFGTYLTKLRTLELVSGKTEIKASDEFFQ